MNIPVSLRKFKCITLEIQKHLLKSVLICAHCEAFIKSGELALKADSLVVCLCLLYAHYFFHSVFKVEIVAVLTKLARDIQLPEQEHIINTEVK